MLCSVFLSLFSQYFRVYVVRQKHALRHSNISVSPNGNRFLTSAKQNSTSPRRPPRTRPCKSARSASTVWKEKVWNHDTLSSSEGNLYILSRTHTKLHSDFFHTLFISRREGTFHGKSANVALVSAWLASHVFSSDTHTHTPPMFINSEKLPEMFSC